MENSSAMYIINSVTKLLHENNRISSLESGFPLSISNLIFYFTHLTNTKSRNKRNYTPKTIESYIFYLKRYHRENNLPQTSFCDPEFLDFEASNYTSLIIDKSQDSIEITEKSSIDSDSESDIDPIPKKALINYDSKIKSITRLLSTNNKIPKGTTGFPISIECLVFYVQHLQTRVLNNTLALKSMDRYIEFLKSFHRLNNLSMNAFNSPEYVKLYNIVFKSIDSVSIYSSDSDIDVLMQEQTEQTTEQTETSISSKKILESNEYIWKSITKLLQDTRKISKNESGFPITVENLILYITKLKSRSDISQQTMKVYLSNLKRYHRIHDLDTSAFDNQVFIDYWKIQIGKGKVLSNVEIDTFSEDFQAEYSKGRTCFVKSVTTVVDEVSDQKNHLVLISDQDFKNDPVSIALNNDSAYKLAKLKMVLKVKEREILNMNDSITSLMEFVNGDQDKGDIFYYFATTGKL